MITIAPPLELDPEQVSCRVDGKDVRLTRMEFFLLKFLMQESGKVVSRQRIVTELWSEQKPTNLRTIDFHIYGLRRAFRTANVNFDPVRVVRGVGYGFNTMTGKNHGKGA